MKKLFSSLFFVFIFVSMFAQNKENLSPKIAKRIQNENAQPSFVQFKENAQPSILQSVSTLKEYLQSPSTTNFIELQSENDAFGYTHKKFQQYYQNLKVEFGIYKTHNQNGKMLSMNGEYYPIENLNITPVFSPINALMLAQQKIGAANYLTGTTASDVAMGYNGTNTELVIFPKIVNVSKENRLAYKMDIYSTSPLYRATVYVDAQSGEVFFENNKIHHTDIGASGLSVYDGTVNFTADYTGTNYRLRQASSGSGIQTFNMNNGTNYSNATDFTSLSTTFNATKGVQAHYAAEKTHAYYLQNHNRNSFNGTGGIIKSYVSYSTNYVNAFWNGSVMTYGDGNGSTYGPLTTLDIVGHEITHGVTEYSANLVYQKESGALNESFSDIFGEVIENFAKGSNNWLMGSEIYLTTSGAIRSMSNPKSYGDPDCYGGTYWVSQNCTPTSSNDYCGVHTNSGVQNKWFYLLVNGGSGTNDVSNYYTVSGIGMNNAAKIAYRNLTVYLNSNSNYTDARNGAIQAAIDLFGANSPEVIATTNAWYAVGVGNAYGGTTPPPTANCVGGSMNLVLKLDNYPSETSWNIKDNSNTIVAQGSGYTQVGSLMNLPISLSPGNYTFTINDSYGDGICCAYGQGYYHLISGTDTVKSGGAFGTSESQTFCVSVVADTIAPSVPLNLTASNTTQNSTDLSWSASTDNVGVSQYKIYQNNALIDSASGTTYTVNGLNPGTTYAFLVKAEDAAGNISAGSTLAIVTTLANSTSSVLHQGYFETGWDGWIDGGGDCSRYSSASRSYEGNYCIYIRDNSGNASSMSSPSFNLSTYDNVVIEFYFYNAGVENGESFWLRYSNGSGWTTLRTYVKGSNFLGGKFYKVTAVIPSSSANFTSNTSFRLQANASDNSDLIYIDAVTITGYVGTPNVSDAIVQVVKPLNGINDAIGEEVGEIALDNFTLYPNPAQDVITIAGVDKVYSVMIFDISGKLLLKKNMQEGEDEEINISTLSKGVYILKAYADDKYYTKRFMKN